MIDTSVPLIDMARDAVRNMGDDEKIKFAIEVCLDVADPTAARPALTFVSDRIAQRKRIQAIVDRHENNLLYAPKEAPAVSSGSDVGFYDLRAAKAFAEKKRSARQKRSAASRGNLPLSAYPRICVPGVLFNRAIQAIITPLVLAGPEAVKRLEPYAEQLCHIPYPSRWQRLVRGAVLWLLEERDDAPEAIKYSDPDEKVSPAAVPDLLDLPQEKRKQILEDFGSAVLAGGMRPEGILADAHDLPKTSVRGVR